MLFNSIDFAVFFPLVFILYWFVTNKSLKLQNALLLVASYIFYGWWDWKFLSLIVLSTAVDYIIGLQLGNETDEGKRKKLLFVSILVNLGLLGFFKYYNFFIDNFKTAFSFFGASFNVHSLDIVLPVGISFYTFQTMSYTIDVYRKKLEPTSNLLAFSTFVSFFPQLVAGPIERASNLLPQILSKRHFNRDLAIQGVFQIYWGMFKKIVIADNAAILVNLIFESDHATGSVRILGAILFAFQIYGDFSGYSDIAIGLGKLLGIKLMTNFRFPYFSRDIAEFWRRWHISLSTWFKDYLYIPLGGSRVSKLKAVRNTFIIFMVSGFWHGANWTFIIWGFLNALYFLPLLLLNKNRANLDVIAEDKVFGTFKELVQVLITFALTILAWIFFRAENLTHALSYLSDIFTMSVFKIPKLNGANNSNLLILSIYILLLLLLEWIYRQKDFVFEGIEAKSLFFRLLLLVCFTIIFFYFTGESQDFIYFQF